MIKRTIEISREAVHLSVRLDQLLVQPFDQEKDAAASIPCEDIGVVALDHGRSTYSHHSLATLMRFGAVVVVCGDNHLPAGMLLPLSRHTEVVQRLREQIAVGRVPLKQLWKQIVIAKVKAQARNLDPESVPARRLAVLAKEVRSGDTTNVEAQAAKVYWSAWIEGPFQRVTDGHDPVNAMLNYGYAVLRASVARAIVSAGLHPALGIHHSNRSNAFCLADDLIEPLRPMIDRRVRDLHRQGRLELNQPTKASLLAVLTDPVITGDQRGPLMVQLHDYVASLVRCYRGEQQNLAFPILAEA